jgi:hypothetical protein
MCHYFIGFQTYDRLPKPRAMWRCSTCGRESQVPINCCNRSSLTVMPQPGIGHIVRQWLRAIATQAVTGLAAMRQRYRSSEPDIRVTDVPVVSMVSAAADPALPESDIETAELEEKTHVAV